MAQQPAQTELEPEDPLEVLRAGLMQDQVAATEEAALRIADSGRNMVVNEGTAQSRGSFADQAYSGIVARANQESRTPVITNQSVGSVIYDREAGGRYIGTLPAGAKVTGPNAVTKTLSDGSVEVFVKQTMPDVPPAKVFQAQQEAYSRPQGASFHLENEEAKIRDLTGQERLDAITKLLSNINAQATNRRQVIGQQAAIQSGYTSAQVALDRALQVEQLPNPLFGGLSFAQRFGVPSAQTIQAQEFLRTTQIGMTQLEESMLRKDSEYNKYAEAQRRMLGIEAQVAQRQARSQERSEERSLDRAERAEAKREAMADAIPQHQVAAYQVLNPNTTSDQAVAQLAKMQKTNPEFIATQTTSENVYVNLVHPDLAVRNNTLKVLKEHDNANNAGFEGAAKSPVAEKIKKYAATPTLLEKDAPQLMKEERIKDYTQQIAAADPKLKPSIRQAYHAELLRRVVEIGTENILVDMRNWKATEASTGTPLGNVIASVVKSNTAGKAPMQAVITQYINDPTVKRPDGSIVPYEERVQTLQAALSGALGNQFKTMMYADVSDLQNKLMNQVTTMSARANINMKVLQMGTPGFQYQTYSPGRNISNIPQP